MVVVDLKSPSSDFKCSIQNFKTFQVFVRLYKCFIKPLFFMIIPFRNIGHNHLKKKRKTQVKKNPSLHNGYMTKYEPTRISCFCLKASAFLCERETTRRSGCQTELIMRSLVLSVWWCGVAAAVSGDVVYLRAQTNTSVRFSCHYPEGKAPFAFQLSHSSPDKKILYHLFEVDPYVEDDRWRSRIKVQHDRPNRSVLLMLEVLQLDDSDLYRCLFHYSVLSEFKQLYAENPIVLFVEGSHPSHSHIQVSSRENGTSQPPTSQKQSDVKPVCSDAHKPLLYALSCATGLLIISVLIIVAVYCNKPSGKNKSQHQFPTPVYEEMNGVRDKATLLVQVNDPLAAYALPRKENPYIN